jgi:cysteine desulfurase/selenocysteine lyase
MRDIAYEFPTLAQSVNGNELVYLDSAATSMRPERVLHAIDNFYRTTGANPHRGVYVLGEQATAAYDGSRVTIAKFVGADTEEIIFTRNATESLNLIAYSYAPMVLKPGDNIVIPIWEHHSNIVPWQVVTKKIGAELRYLYLDKNGEIAEGEIDKKIDARTKIVSWAQVSNVLGGLAPMEQLLTRAKQVGATTIVDVAQSVPHFKLNLHELGADFAVFSGHKMYGPMGIGVLYGKRELLDAMPPFLYGGDMIETVREQETTYAPLPSKFEAGTQNAGGAVGLEEATFFIEEVGFECIAAHEAALMKRLITGLNSLPHVHVLGNSDPNAARYGVAAFNIDEVHSHDAASILDSFGICIRAGEHCAHPLLNYLGEHSSCRASLGVYNTERDVDRLIEKIPEVRKTLRFKD